MKTQIKTIGTINSKGNPLLIAKIRTEHELIISPETLATVEKVVAKLADNNELIQEDKAYFAWELSQIVALYKEYAEHLATGYRLESEWQNVSGFLSLDTLKTIADSTANLHSIRLEGSPDNNFRLVLQSGIEILEIAATRDNLVAAKAEADSIIQNAPEASAATDWIVAFAAMIAAGLALWDRYDKWQEEKKKKEQEEQKKKEKEYRDHERLDRPERGTCESAAGGPAFDDAMDRISRTA